MVASTTHNLNNVSGARFVVALHADLLLTHPIPAVTGIPFNNVVVKLLQHLLADSPLEQVGVLPPSGTGVAPTAMAAVSTAMIVEICILVE